MPTQGLLESVVRLTDTEFLVPEYTTESRRQGGLGLERGPAPTSEARHIVVDSTGLKMGSRVTRA